MALDGIVLRAIADELQMIVGARIHKIHQPSDSELVLGIRGAGVSGRLLLSANPTYPRIHWTTASYTNPLEAPMFCMLLRKHCEGGVIESVRQSGRERVLHIGIRHRDEVGDVSGKTLIVEIMGRHSNIILLDSSSGVILDGIHHVTPAISSYRIILPGSVYTPPPEQEKHDPLGIADETQFARLVAVDSEEGAAPLSSKLVSAFSGLSPLLAKEIVHRAAADTLAKRANENAVGGTSAPDMSALWESFHALMSDVAQSRYSPVVVNIPENGKSAFSITPLTHLEGETTSFPSISLCLEAFFGGKAERDTVKQRAADLIRFVQNERAKNASKIQKLEETLAEARDADKYRVLGELLTAYMHQIKRGDTEAELIDFYDENQRTVTIPLDPQLSPSDNAQRYFRRYTKHRNSIAVVTEQMKLAEQEIAYFAGLLQQLDSASLADIEEIRDELVQGGYLKEKKQRGPKRKKAGKPALICYTSSEGIAIYVGKNNTQNEFLTNRLAAAADTWLHTKDIPGSHVVIRSERFGDATLEEAAMLAAHYSQARASSMVPVDFTKIRHVRKPSGAKPGFVIYDNQKTLFVTPDAGRLGSLPTEVK